MHRHSTLDLPMTWAIRCPSSLFFGALIVALIFANPATLAQDTQAQEPTKTAPQASSDKPAKDEAVNQRLLQLEARIRELEQDRGRARENSGAETPTADNDDLTLDDVRKGLLSKITLYGAATASYTYSLNQPPTRQSANTLRVNDADHNTFAVNQVSLGLKKELRAPTDYGFQFDIHVGNSVDDIFSFDQEVLGGEEINIGRAFVNFRTDALGLPIEIKIGQDYGWFTVETNDLFDNPLFSLSYFAAFTPYLNTGLFATVQITDELSYMQYIGNGSEVLVDNNNAKTVGGQLAYNLESSNFGTFIALNWLYGAERDDNVSDQRFQIELDAVLRAQWKMTAYIMLMYGQEEGANVRNGRTAKFGGGSLALRQEFSGPNLIKADKPFNPFAVIVRGTVFRDQGGANSGRNQTLSELTAAFEFRPHVNAWIRFEYRQDRSSESNVFPGKNSANSRRKQDSFSVSVSVKF